MQVTRTCGAQLGSWITNGKPQPPTQPRSITLHRASPASYATWAQTRLMSASWMNVGGMFSRHIVTHEPRASCSSPLHRPRLKKKSLTRFHDSNQQSQALTPGCGRPGRPDQQFFHCWPHPRRDPDLYHLPDIMQVWAAVTLASSACSPFQPPFSPSAHAPLLEKASLLFCSANNP